MAGPIMPPEDANLRGRLTVTLLDPAGQPEGKHLAAGASVPNVLLKGDRIYVRASSTTMLRVEGNTSIIGSMVGMEKA